VGKVGPYLPTFEAVMLERTGSGIHIPSESGKECNLAVY
jgi:hypothetical protein